MLEHFVLGYHDVVADMIWIRAIQDFDYCEQKDKNNNCQNQGWLFRELDTITNLSPRFRIVYATGGPSLSVLVGDVEGARQLFEKGAREFPSDWRILYRAAYHYLYEVKDNIRAAELLVQAGKNGAPPWVFALATRLYTKEGKIQLGQALLAQLTEQGAEEQILQRLRDRINEAKKKE